MRGVLQRASYTKKKRVTFPTAIGSTQTRSPRQLYGPVAQWIERLPAKWEALRSSRSGPII